MSNKKGKEKKNIKIKGGKYQSSALGFTDKQKEVFYKYKMFDNIVELNKEPSYMDYCQFKNNPSYKPLYYVGQIMYPKTLQDLEGYSEDDPSYNHVYIKSDGFFILGHEFERSITRLLPHQDCVLAIDNNVYTGNPKFYEGIGYHFDLSYSFGYMGGNKCIVKKPVKKITTKQTTTKKPTTKKTVKNTTTKKPTTKKPVKKITTKKTVKKTTTKKPTTKKPVKKTTTKKPTTKKPVKKTSTKKTVTTKKPVKKTTTKKTTTTKKPVKKTTKK